jgi:hypothetical protein
MSSAWPTVKVRDGKVNFRLETTANINSEGFQTFLVSGSHRILFLQSVNFEELLESLNVFTMAFGVLNYRIENTF